MNIAGIAKVANFADMPNFAGIANFADMPNFADMANFAKHYVAVAIAKVAKCPTCLCSEAILDSGFLSNIPLVVIDR